MRVFGAVASLLVAAVSSAVMATVEPQPASSAPLEWHISATLSEACSCTVSCPCNFGGKPSHDPCQGNRMITINTGHVGNVDLAGVSFLVAWDLSSWSKIYVSDQVTDAQNTALQTTILPVAWSQFRRGGVPVTKAPLTMQVTEERVRFSSPESSVDMEVMKGAGQQPIKVLNLPNPYFQDYTQYRSVVHQHTEADHSFSHSGTNGLTSTWDAGSQ
jgi:Protein of unknown function (DUF1326)